MEIGGEGGGHVCHLREVWIGGQEGEGIVY